jgi:hypothetical protein
VYRTCLVVCSTNPLVDNVDHVLSRDGSVHDEGNKADHGQASIDDFGFLGKASFEGRKVSISFFVLSHSPVDAGAVGVQKKGIAEGQWADGGHEGNSKEVGVGNKDEGTFVGDHGLSRDGGEGSPFSKVKGHVSIGDQSVSLAVCSGADEDPSEHGMTSIPLFCLDGRSPSPLGECGKLALPVGYGIIVDRGVDDVQRRRGTVGRVQEEW